MNCYTYVVLGIILFSETESCHEDQTSLELIILPQPLPLRAGILVTCWNIPGEHSCFVVFLEIETILPIGKLLMQEGKPPRRASGSL